MTQARLRAAVPAGCSDRPVVLVRSGEHDHPVSLGRSIGDDHVGEFGVLRLALSLRQRLADGNDLVVRQRQPIEFGCRQSGQQVRRAGRMQGGRALVQTALGLGLGDTVHARSGDSKGGSGPGGYQPRLSRWWRRSRGGFRRNGCPNGAGGEPRGVPWLDARDWNVRRDRRGGRGRASGRRRTGKGLAGGAPENERQCQYNQGRRRDKGPPDSIARLSIHVAPPVAGVSRGRP